MVDDCNAGRKRWRSSRRRRYNRNRTPLEVPTSLLLGSSSRNLHQSELSADIIPTEGRVRYLGRARPSTTPNVDSGNTRSLTGDVPEMDFGDVGDVEDNGTAGSDDSNVIDTFSDEDAQSAGLARPGDELELSSEENNAMGTVCTEDESGKLQLGWNSIAAILLCTGTTRLNQSHYDMVRRFINWKPTAEQSRRILPSTATVKRLRHGPFQKVVVASTTIMYPVDMSKSGARTAVGKYASESEAPVTVVKPSSWAKLDLSTRRIADLVLGKRRDAAAEVQSCFTSIEDTPIVQCREDALSCFHIPAVGDGYMAVREGTMVSVRFTPRDSTERLCIIQSFHGIKGDDPHLICRVRSTFIYKGRPDLDTAVELNKKQERSAARQEKKKRRRLNSKPPVKLFAPGDAVVLLTPNVNGIIRDSEKVILIYRMLRTECENDWAITLILTSQDVDSKTTLQSGQYQRFRVEQPRACSVDHVRSPEISYAPNEGVLQDGRRYVIYRMLLYCDGFSPNVSRKGSCTGVYMLPLGIDPENREGAGAVRPIALAPPGVSQNDILRTIFLDVMEGTTKGFNIKDTSGNECVLFLDLVGFVADSPAVAASQDLLGHMSNNPFPLCTFARYDVSGRGGSRYAYSSSIHSSMPCFSRHTSRSEALRMGGIKDEDLKKLGMKSNQACTESGNVLSELSQTMEEVRCRVPLTNTGVRVVPCMFDCYRSAVVAPDHLILGLGQNLTDTLLKLLPPSVRRYGETICKSLLREGDLTYQNHLFDHKNIGLHSMSITAMFSFLLVAPHAFRCALHLDRTENVRDEVHLLVSLLEDFSSLISDTYSLPRIYVDGRDEVVQHNEQGGMNRIWNLRGRCVQYVTDLDKCYKALSNFPDTRNILDKPNVHRLLELYTHTLPNFGHVLHVQELLFEGAHQPLKRALSRSNHLNYQLQAMEHRIANDWKNRLAIECEGGGVNVMDWNMDICVSVLRLLGWEKTSFHDFGSLRKELSEMLPSPVLHILDSYRDELSGRLDRCIGWKVDGTSYNGPQEEYDGLENLLLYCKTWLREKLSTVLGRTYSGVIDSSVYGGAKWTVMRGQSRTTFRSLCRISYGQVVQALCPERIYDLEKNGVEWVREASITSKPSFWMVVAVIECLPRIDVEDILHVPDEYQRLTSVAVKCLEKDGEAYILAHADHNSLPALIDLGFHVRKAMVIHDCERDEKEGGVHCELRLEGNVVQHGKAIQDGGLYKVYGRSRGFPPRSG